MPNKKSHDPLIYKNLDENAERDINDYYPTPDVLVYELLPYLNLKPHMRVLDLGCGTGKWGKIIKERYNNIIVDGIDIQQFPNNSLDNYDNVFFGDFINYEFPDIKYDIIGFNPPFYLMSDRKYLQAFKDKMFQLLDNNGKIMFILPNTYLSGINRYSKFNKHHLETYVQFINRVDWLSEKNSGKNHPRKEHGFFIYNKQINNKTSLEMLDNKKTLNNQHLTVYDLMEMPEDVQKQIIGKAFEDAANDPEYLATLIDDSPVFYEDDDYVNAKDESFLEFIYQEEINDDNVLSYLKELETKYQLTTKEFIRCWENNEIVYNAETIFWYKLSSRLYGG